jgi:crotonobetainyl-CoA:carnitine CoA-transferase CaiB-like acyl-CoA transferase
VETSLLEAGLELQADGFPMFLNRGGEPPRRSRSGVGAHPDMPAPYGVYPTADGYVAIVGAPPAILAEVLGEEYLTPDPALSRDANRDRVLERMAEVVKERPTAHWMERLKSDAGMVMEVLDWRQLSESGGFADLEIVATEPNDRGVRVMRTPIRFDGERPPVPSAAPRLNGDEDDVRRFGWR